MPTRTCAVTIRAPRGLRACIASAVAPEADLPAKLRAGILAFLRFSHQRRRGWIALLSNEAGVSSTITDLVAKGRLGIKTKGGLFDYTDEQVGQLRAQRGASLVKVRKALS